MRPPKTWLITDTHWNHSMLIEAGHRPTDFQERIRYNWIRLVADQDTVYHLGDVILGRNSQLGEILADLPGRKILVRGNHDREPNEWYRSKGFAFVAQGILHGGVWLTHAPQAALPDGALINVHGHLHNGDHHDLGQLPEHCKLLSLERVGYTLVEINQFVGFSPLTREIMGMID